MAIEFRLPELGENVEKGDLLKVLVSVGDTISRDQPVLELETDKATIEVPSTVSGKVQAVHVNPGDEVKVGQLILTVQDGAETKNRVQPEGEKGEGKPAPGAKRKPESRAEAQAENKTEAEVQPKPQHPGSKPAAAEEKPEAGQPEEHPAPADGTGAPPVQRAAVVDISRARPAAPEQPQQIAPAAPSVRRRARELGLDINGVPGSGPGGRISAEDVTEYARGIISASHEAGATVAAAATRAPLPDFSQWGEVERQPMSNIRRKTAEHMALAWNTVPQVTQYDRADITGLEELRKRFATKAEEAGGKLTITAIAVKVAASALRLFPEFAAGVDVARKEIVYKKYAHIGVAVDTERGLMVPVIRDADKKNILEISRELAQLAEKARSRKLAPEEMQGGVFTLTNLGGIGGTNFSPIVNYPEVAILGIARASLEPVFLNGEFAPRLILPLSLSYDHRLIDGADAARFLRWVAGALEQPFQLLLQG
jgi:pyruvate dehydrogenase E2 component (dihydrolipoamide acetyltransferase)